MRSLLHRSRLKSGAYSSAVPITSVQVEERSLFECEAYYIGLG